MGTLEFTIIAPAVMLILCAGLQLGMWYLAQEAALTAARKAATAGAAYQARPGDGADRARTWLAGVHLIKGTVVSTAGSSADRVRVTVTGSSLSLVPGWTPQVTKSAEVPVERWDVEAGL
ncbi:TadE family protein [Streptomyces pinistramenti]|uniref:TadE family protein n=1 Tax=Streptomyces pinistramenti TaxID=2884812 RepID=UPI0022228CCA|nr:TadE family protein [Streptomyces pinistramenti]